MEIEMRIEQGKGYDVFKLYKEKKKIRSRAKIALIPIGFTGKLFSVDLPYNLIRRTQS